MTRKRNIGRAAAIGGIDRGGRAADGLPAASADELADLRANQELLQRRIEQLAQAAHGRTWRPRGYGAEACRVEMAIRRQLSALVSDPGHRHLDPRRRVCRRNPRLLLRQAARPTATRARPSGSPAIWSRRRSTRTPITTVPGFPTPGNLVPAKYKTRAATASFCRARGKRASTSRRAHRPPGASHGRSSNSTLPAPTTSAQTT